MKAVLVVPLRVFGLRFGEFLEVVMTTTGIILESFMVDTVKNVTGNSQLPVRITMQYLLGVKVNVSHTHKAIICTLTKKRCSAPVTSIEEFPQRF